MTPAAGAERVFIGTPLTSGFTEFALARQVAVGRLPDAVTFEQGAILQLLPLAVHATRGVRLGDRVAILGQGPVGLMTLQVAARRGAAEIVAADLDQPAVAACSPTQAATGSTCSAGWRPVSRQGGAADDGQHELA